MESMIFASAERKCSQTVACLRAIIRAMSRRVQPHPMSQVLKRHTELKKLFEFDHFVTFRFDKINTSLNVNVPHGVTRREK